MDHRLRSLESGRFLPTRWLLGGSQTDAAGKADKLFLSLGMRKVAYRLSSLESWSNNGAILLEAGKVCRIRQLSDSP